MNKELSKRIDMIKDGEVPSSYVKISNFIIPLGWKVTKLGSLLDKVVGGGTPSRDNSSYYNGNIPWATVKDLQEVNYKKDTIEYITESGLENSSAKLIEKGNFIISTRMGLGRGFINLVDMAINQDLKGIYPKKDVLDVVYLMYWYKNNESTFKNMGVGSTVKGIDLQTLNNMIFLQPKLEEQQKVKVILSTWDKAIELKEKLLKEKQKQKKGLLERLLTGKVRLRGFEGKAKDVALKNYIKESKQKNKDYLEERILSVTNKKGFILQEDQFERVVASSDLSNYKVVVNGQFAYNPSRINVGSIDLLTKFDSGLLSPMYVVFDVKEGLVKEYLFQFLKSSLFLNYIPKLLQGSVRDSLSFDALQLVKLFIPTVEEQQAIADVLSTADKEIELLETELEALKQQKKGLMKLLLTGIVRVKCDL